MATALLIAGCKTTHVASPTLLPALSLDDPSPNVRLVRAIAANRLDLVNKALAEGASANFETTRDQIFPADRVISPMSPIPAVCIEDVSHFGPGPITEALLTAGADPNACRGRSLIGPHNDYNGLISLPAATSLIRHGYMPTAREVEDAQRTLSHAATSGNAMPMAQYRVQLASIVLSGNGPAIEANKEQQFEAQFRAQLDLQDARDVYAGVTRGATVCSKAGIYHQEYAAYIEDREGDRLQLRIAGSKSGVVTEFRFQEVLWDSILKWYPCDLIRR